jgi:hypothetical protein
MHTTRLLPSTAKISDARTNNLETNLQACRANKITLTHHTIKIIANMLPHGSHIVVAAVADTRLL